MRHTGSFTCQSVAHLPYWRETLKAGRGGRAGASSTGVSPPGSEGLDTPLATIASGGHGRVEELKRRDGGDTKGLHLAAQVAERGEIRDAVPTFDDDGVHRPFLSATTGMGTIANADASALADRFFEKLTSLTRGIGLEPVRTRLVRLRVVFGGTRSRGGEPRFGQRARIILDTEFVKLPTERFHPVSTHERRRRAEPL